MAVFEFEGQSLAYTEFGGGPAALAAGGVRGRTARSAAVSAHPLILLHGLLLSQEMHRPLAEELAARGNRVITMDLLGHGASERPRDMWRYSMESSAEQVVALMDHLKIEQAVVMGTSLGANVALEITPLLVARTFGEPVMKLLARATRAVPRQLLPHYGNVMLDLVRQEPGPGGALLQGLFFGRIAPPHAERKTFATPALILGHGRDPVHPFSDAGMLAKEMPNARLLEAESLVELRMKPERLTGEIAAFLDEVWAKPAAPRAKRARAAAAKKPASK